MELFGKKSSHAEGPAGARGLTMVVPGRSYEKQLLHYQSWGLHVGVGWKSIPDSISNKDSKLDNKRGNPGVLDG